MKKKYNNIITASIFILHMGDAHVDVPLAMQSKLVLRMMCSKAKSTL